MSIEEKQNFPIYQDSNSIEYPLNEKELSNLIKKFYKSAITIELIGLGSKRKMGRNLQCDKILSTYWSNLIQAAVKKKIY